MESIIPWGCESFPCHSKIGIQVKSGIDLVVVKVELSQINRNAIAISYSI